MRRIGGVSNEMLISLSLSHLEDKEFDSNREMTNYLRNQNLISDSKVAEFFEEYDRKIFTAKTADYSLSPFKIGPKGVEITNPMMQAVMLDIAASCFRAEAVSKRKVLDIGCCNGFLSFGMVHLLSGSRPDDSFKVQGVDVDEASISEAYRIKAEHFGGSGNPEFGHLDFLEMLEVEKDFTTLVFGVGVTKSDIMSCLLLNGANPASIIAPIFQSNTQQMLTVLCLKDQADSFSNLS